MTDSPVACLIVCYRSLGHLPALVLSLRGQRTLPGEIIFVVNGEDDGTLAFLEAMPERPAIIREPENIGFAAGMNRAIARARSEFVLFLNPDTVLDPEFIAAALSTIRSDPRIAGVGGKLTAEAGAGARLDSTGIVMQPWWRFVDRGRGGVDDGRYDRTEDMPALCGAAVLFRRAALVEVAEDGQVLDEDFWMYKEDVDLSLRLREFDHRLVYEPRARAVHRRGFGYGDRTRAPLSLRRASLRNRYLLLLKHWKAPEDLLRLPLLLVFDLLVFFAIMLREPRTATAYVAALRSARRMLDKRRRRRARLRSRAGRTD